MPYFTKRQIEARDRAKQLLGLLVCPTVLKDREVRVVRRVIAITAYGLVKLACPDCEAECGEFSALDVFVVAEDPPREDS